MTCTARQSFGDSSDHKEDPVHCRTCAVVYKQTFASYSKAFLSFQIGYPSIDGIPPFVGWDPKNVIIKSFFHRMLKEIWLLSVSFIILTLADAALPLVKTFQSPNSPPEEREESVGMLSC